MTTRTQRPRYATRLGYSRFYLSDLQVHTPADRRHRYGDVGGRGPNDDFAQRLVQAHADAGVEVRAVTDHNRVDWYPALRNAGRSVGVIVFRNAAAMTDEPRYGDVAVGFGNARVAPRGAERDAKLPDSAT